MAALAGRRPGTIEDRREQRLSLLLEGATLREPNYTSARVRVLDLSPGGFRTEWPYLLECGSRVWLTLPGFPPMPACVVWTSNFTIGCRFDRPLYPGVLSLIAHDRGARE